MTTEGVFRLAAAAVLRTPTSAALQLVFCAEGYAFDVRLVNGASAADTQSWCQPPSAA